MNIKKIAYVYTSWKQWANKIDQPGGALTCLKTASMTSDDGLVFRMMNELRKTTPGREEEKKKITYIDIETYINIYANVHNIKLQKNHKGINRANKKNKYIQIIGAYITYQYANQHQSLHKPEYKYKNPKLQTLTAV